MVEVMIMLLLMLVIMKLIVMSNVQLSITEPITEEAGPVRVTQGRQHRYPHTCNSSNIDNQVRKPSVTLSSSDTEPVVKDLG